MPELPEVETTRIGIEKTLVNQCIRKTIIRDSRLRWPVPNDLPQHLNGNTITQIKRRAKYLLLETPTGTLIIHLGMSGCLKIQHTRQPPVKHDHVELVLNNQYSLRYHDPRRFGAVLWTSEPAELHPLLATLGVEPLTHQFNTRYLHRISQQRHCQIKQLIMNSKVVVGIGNIYASEALFVSGISPTLPATQLSQQRCKRLVHAIKKVLRQAIACGGTTLKDFHNVDGKPGYFKQKLHVYGRESQPCNNCQRPIKRLVIQQRATFYCTRCQH